MGMGVSLTYLISFSLMKIRTSIFTLALGALLAQGSSITMSAQSKTKTPAINFADMDKSVRPQNDFYHYVNGGWIRKNPLKPAYSRFGTFDVLSDTMTSQRLPHSGTLQPSDG